MLIGTTYSQVVSQETINVINSIRAVNEIRYDDLSDKGLKSPQYFNYINLLNSSSKEELLYFTNDTNEIVKGYVYLALLDRQDKELESFYIRSVQNKEKVVSYSKGIYSEILLYDFLRSKVYDKITANNYDATTDTFYNKMSSNFDSILIMDYSWNESDVFIDYIIESTSEGKGVLSKRKSWLANSYFEHKIAKRDDAYLFGRLCGYPEKMPYLRSVVEKSMNDTLLNRLGYFDKWVNCDILVVKVYGVEGLKHKVTKQIIIISLCYFMLKITVC